MGYNIKFNRANQEYIYNSLANISIDYNNFYNKNIITFKSDEHLSGFFIFLTNGVETYYLSRIGENKLRVKAKTTQADVTFSSNHFVLNNKVIIEVNIIAGNLSITVNEEVKNNIITGLSGIILHSGFAINGVPPSFSTSQMLSTEIEFIQINTETFTFPEGSGSTTTGSLGTVLTLNSTASTDDMWVFVPSDLPLKRPNSTRDTSTLNIINFGQFGYKLLEASGTKLAVTKPKQQGVAFVALEDSVVTVSALNSSNLIDLPILAGMSFKFPFYELYVSSGSVLAYGDNTPDKVFE